MTLYNLFRCIQGSMASKLNENSHIEFSSCRQKKKRHIGRHKQKSNSITDLEDDSSIETFQLTDSL